MALNLESINNALEKAFGRTINLEEKAFENDDASDNKFEGIEDDFCIFSGNESQPLRLMISKIREQEGFTEASDKLIENMISRAAKPGGGLHFYEKGEGENPTYTPKFVSIEEDELGQASATQSTVEQYKSLTPPPVSEPYQRSKFALFFKKLFKSKSKKAELQRKHDQYQTNKAAYEDSLRLTDEAVNNGKSLRETNGLKESEKARFKEMLPEVKKEKDIAEKRAQKNQDFMEDAPDEDELEEIALKKIQKVMQDKTFNIFTNDKLFANSKVANKITGINEPGLDKRPDNYHEKWENALGGTKTDELTSDLQNKLHALRFGCVMQELCTKGTKLNTAMGGNILHLPLSLIKAELGEEMDDDVKQIMGEVLKVAAEKSDNILETFGKNPVEAKEMMAIALSSGMKTCNKMLMGMPPKEIQDNPVQFLEIANMLKVSTEGLKITNSHTLSKEEINTAYGFAEIARAVKESSYCKEESCREIQNTLNYVTGRCTDKHHEQDYFRIKASSDIQQLMQEFYTESQEMNIDSNENYKQIINNAQTQDKSTKNLALTIGGLAATMPYNEAICKLGEEAMKYNICTNHKGIVGPILHQEKDLFLGRRIEDYGKNVRGYVIDEEKPSVFSYDCKIKPVNQRKELFEIVDNLVNKKATLGRNTSTFAEFLRCGLTAQKSLILAQQRCQEKALPQINNPDANKEHAKNAEMAK